MVHVNLRKIEKILSLVLLKIKNNTIAGFTDDAKMLEFLISDIFNVVYGYNLVNTNQIKANAEFFDLEDLVNKIKVQVTINFNKTKLEKTLGKANIAKDTIVYLLGLESVSNSKEFNALIEQYEKANQIVIKKVDGNELYKLIVGMNNIQKTDYLLSILEEHIDVNSLEVISDEQALESILHIFNRDAIKCHYSCEGCFQDQLRALEEIKQYIHRGVIDGTKLASNKPLSKFKKSILKNYLMELDDLLQDFIRAIRKGDKKSGEFFYYDQNEYKIIELSQQKLIDELNKNNFGIDFKLYN